MNTHIRTSFLFSTFTLFILLNSLFLRNTIAQDNTQSVDIPATANYTFETIEVPGVDFLSLTASSDFEDYAGYTRSPDSEDIVAFTLIDGVFKTYAFPNAHDTRFYALGNNGNAAGHYLDSEGRSHGVILENGELRQYDFPDAVETEIFGISDATGALTGNYIDDSGIRRGFSGDTIVEFPGALETYADFVNSEGGMVGSYVDADGIYHGYVRVPDGDFVTLNLTTQGEQEYFFVHGINDARVVVARDKLVDGLPRTLVGLFPEGLQELIFPDSVSTEGWNINQDGSIVGHYDTADGRRHGFIANPIMDTTPPDEESPDPQPIFAEYTFETIDVPGVDFLALTASSDFEDYAGYTRSADGEKEVAFTLINGVFTTYDFPDSQKTHFYALDNSGNAAGHYEDHNGLYHGVVLEDGVLRQYDFPGAVQTFIHGISEATGDLTGSFIDASGVRRGFSGDLIIEYPEASATYAEFTHSQGGVIGSFVDAQGVFYPYIRNPDGRFISLELPHAAQFEYFFLPGVNDAGIVIARAKLIGDVPRTAVGTLQHGLQSLEVPGSVSTEGWNINQDGSIVGYYDTADGLRHGFIARPDLEDTPVPPKPETPSAKGYYTYESIDVPGVDILDLTASSDFGDYAGNTRSQNGEKTIGFTLIDGVFTTYDFPGSQHTYFYALGNNGVAAGHYKDSDGLYHGVVLDENGELKQYDFPGAVQTFIFGISDETGAMSGNIVDTNGVFHGFSGDMSITFPGAEDTFADFVNADGVVVGSYITAEGTVHGFIRDPHGNFTSIDIPGLPNLEFLYVNAINNDGVVIFRAKAVDDIQRSYILLPGELPQELQFPGSVRTVVRNINQDGSIIGNYRSADGRVHGFVGIPTEKAVSDHFGNFYNVALTKGLNMLSLPLTPPTPMTAKSLAGITGSTVVITLDAANQRFIGWTPSAPDNGFEIKGGQGYIVNVPQTRNFAFVGAPWTNQNENAAAPAISTEMPQAAWAFVVSGHLDGKPTYDGYQVITRNLRTNSTITASVQGDYFAAATADLTQRSVVQVGDEIEIRVIGPNGNVESKTRNYKVTHEHLANAILSVQLDNIGKPMENQLLQNYPNPFNPETWIPYQLSQDSPVSISIYGTTGKLIRTLSLGFQSAGFYNSRGRAAYWDGKNEFGEVVASGLYFYTLSVGDFTTTRKMLIRK